MKIETVEVETIERRLNVRFGDFGLKVQQLSCLGNLDLIELNILGLVCSSKCPGSIILETHQLIKELGKSDSVVASGFHSPVEKDCLETLLRGNSRLIICPARGIQTMRIPVAWRGGIDTGRILVLSPFDESHQQVSRRLAEDRNRFVGMLATRIVVPNAEPGSKTEAFCIEMLELKKNVLLSMHCVAPELIRLGAENISLKDLAEAKPAREHNKINQRRTK